MGSLSLRIFLERIYCEDSETVFTKSRKTPQRDFPSIADMDSRSLLPKCDKLEKIINKRGRSQVDMLDQRHTGYRDSVLLKSKNDPNYFNNYLKACQDWLTEEEYNPVALKKRLIPWLRNYIPNEIDLPVPPSSKLFEAISLLLQEWQPLQAHAEAMMWLMLYAALGNDFKMLQPASESFSVLVQGLPRQKEVSDIVNFLTSERTGKNIAILCGNAGIGKSFVANQVLQALKGKGIKVSSFLDSRTLCEETNRLMGEPKLSTGSLLFVDDAPEGFEKELSLRRLSNRGFKILIATQWKPEKEDAGLKIFPIEPFSKECLSNYFLSQMDKRIPQPRRDKIYSKVMEIAEKVECNTDLFLLLGRSMLLGAFEPENILEMLEQCKTKNIIVNHHQPLSTYVYELFFSKGLSTGQYSDKLVLYICCMAFLPKKWVFREQLHKLMEPIDPNETIMQELLAYRFLKSEYFYNEEWEAYADGQLLFYYINDNMRQVIFLSFEKFIGDSRFSSELYDFLRRLKDEFSNCRDMKNVAPEKDVKSYLNLMVWQSIARFLIKSARPLLNLIPDRGGVSDLLYTVSNLFYFGSIYDDALTALTLATEIKGYEDEEIKQSRLRLASVTGNDIDDAECEESALGFWRCLQKEELWQLPCPAEEKKQHILNELGFTQLKVDVVPRNAEVLMEKSKELTDDGWLVLRIHEEEKVVKLYSLKSEQVHIRQIKFGHDEASSDQEKVTNLLQCTYILPKISWKTTPKEMIINGLKTSRYAGWGIFKNAEDEKLLSYVDIKLLRPDETGYAQIGFAATDVESRSHRYSQFLINHIRLEYPLRGTFFTTHEQNGSMRRAAKELGYEECTTKEYNRIVESMATLRYEKEALVKG